MYEMIGVKSTPVMVRPGRQVEIFAFCSALAFQNFGHCVARAFDVFRSGNVHYSSNKNAPMSFIFFVSKSQIHPFISTCFKAQMIGGVQSMKVPFPICALNWISVCECIPMSILIVQVEFNFTNAVFDRLRFFWFDD